MAEANHTRGDIPIIADAKQDRVPRNLVLSQLLGLCPLLAVTTTAWHGLLLGVATCLTLVSTGAIISSLRSVIAYETRLLVFVIVIACMVGVADLLLETFFYIEHQKIGLFIPLIVTNCAIFATLETFAVRHKMTVAVGGSLMRGLGLASVLLLIGLLRELAATGKLSSLLNSATTTPAEIYVQLAILPPGAFFALALLISLHKWFENRALKG